VTPFIADPYLTLAEYALGTPADLITQAEIQAAEVIARKTCTGDPPFLPKFLSEYPTLDRKDAPEISDEEAEGLLQSLWRGDLNKSMDPHAGPYTHFKGAVYLCYGQALLLQGTKEEPAVVYSNQAGDVYIRPLREWVEIVKWADGKYRPRFMEEGSF
jgi:hypothetical protein